MKITISERDSIIAWVPLSKMYGNSSGYYETTHIEFTIPAGEYTIDSIVTLIEGIVEDCISDMSDNEVSFEHQGTCVIETQGGNRVTISI